MPEIIGFLAYSRPRLPPGDYQIDVGLQVSLDPAPFTTRRTFTVAGERHSLAPAAVHGMFPPMGSLGDHPQVLPHIMLTRPTLPWERPAGVDGPWLVLLVFSGDEQPEPQSVRRAALSGGSAYCSAPLPETHELPDDSLTVIDVPRELLRDLMPGPADLPFLAHVRRSADGEHAVVLAGRSPKPGVSSTAHLVSVEHRYSATGFDLGPDRAGAKVRLVSLASWQFACLSADHTFAALARDLTPAPSALPDSGDPAADLYLRQGYVPARHRLRQGGRTVSWYRGPLLAGPVPAEPRRAARTSDALLRYHRDCGMFDTSLASAWQLGRLLALQHTAAASAIATWRRRRAQQAARQIPADHPLAVAEIDTALPPAAADLLTNLAGLDGVPFRYLVPDERLLPEESVRLFQVDRTWTEALVDGAFSVGRLTSADAELDRAGPPPVDIPVLSGALIRSTLISGYPSLKVDAYAGTRPLPVRLERLSPTMLLCLAEGVLTRLDLHQPQSAQHFGLASPPAGPRGTVSAAALAQSLGAADSAAFAARMTETAERVTFQV